MGYKKNQWRIILLKETFDNKNEEKDGLTLHYDIIIWPFLNWEFKRLWVLDKMLFSFIESFISFSVNPAWIKCSS